jgi:hypothetical protein
LPASRRSSPSRALRAPIYEGQPDWRTALAALEHDGFTPVHLATVTRDASLRVVEFDYLGVRSAAVGVD